MSRTSTLPAVGAGLLFACLATAVIALTAGALTRFEIVGPTVAFAYPWRLVEPSSLSHASAWVGYAVHNLAAWGVIAAARREGRWTSRFARWNWWMLAVNVVGIGAHVVQSRLWYDGLAQDVPEVTALGSVALMLMVVLILEAPRRGLILRRLRSWPQRMLRIVREYHGYLFSWALIYTFWYHPTEGTQGHLMGFAYMFVLLWQSVLLFHDAHRDRRWTLLLELLVIPHGILVALHQGKGLAPMFGFGFGAIFFLTQMYGLGWSSTRRRIAGALFVVGTVGVYAGTGRLAQLHEITRIPVADYGVVALLYGLYVVGNFAAEKAGLVEAG